MRFGKTGWLALALLIIGFLAEGSLAGAVGAGADSGPDPADILVEIFLAADQKPNLETIKKEFASFRIVKVRAKFFTLGHPPENIAIGRHVSAPVARLAIRLARTYNGGVTLLLPGKRLAADYLAIGTSIFDESFQVPISPDELERLADPSLTTEQFHELYRQLAKEDQPRYSR